MKDYTNDGEIKIKCNIPITQLLSVSIEECISWHAAARITARMESETFDAAYQRLQGEPLLIYSTKNNQDTLIFYGVIFELDVEKKAAYEIARIEAYSLSWLMDLERKSRSFQDTADTLVTLIQEIAQESSFYTLCSANDQEIAKLFIQYQETDWEFLLRLSTHLHVPLIPASDYEGRGLYLGFRERSDPDELYAASEIWRMDADQRHEDWQKAHAAYYEVDTGQIFHVGQNVIYKDQTLWVYRASMFLERGMLQCKYQLTAKEYDPFPIIYNPHLRCHSLQGTVLERVGETVKVHFDMDEVQDEKRAYAYPWMPEYGNMVYCMPEKGSKVRLLIPGEDEQTAICINCVRQSADVCREMQHSDNRWFVTDNQKKLMMQPSSIELAADGCQSKIFLQDGLGSFISGGKEVMIQAEGRVTLKGSEVRLSAPAEITFVKRQLGKPVVVNVCHNLDSIGEHTQFRNLPAVNLNTFGEIGDRHTGIQEKAGKDKIEKQEEKREKLRLKMNKLLETNTEDTYQLGAAILNVASAIPQIPEQDRLSQIAAGFRPITGNVKGK